MCVCVCVFYLFIKKIQVFFFQKMRNFVDEKKNQYGRGMSRLSEDGL
jgi:hypothetical protein